MKVELKKGQKQRPKRQKPRIFRPVPTADMLLPKLATSFRNVNSKILIRAMCQKVVSDDKSNKKQKVTLKTKERPVSAKIPKIYTKTGDNGNSSLFTGERRPKNDEAFEALGTIDELSSQIGLAMATANPNLPYLEELQRIQCILQDIGSVVATPNSSARKAHLEKLPNFSQRHTIELQEWIDEYTKVLPILQNFILPGGSTTSATLHVARAICRRAERRVWPLVNEEEIDIEACRYLNRLSDYLFMLARYAAKTDNKEETIYIRPDPRVKPYKPITKDIWKKN